MEELDLLQLVNSVIKEKKRIGVVVLIFAIVGFIYSFLLENQYTSTTIFVPRTEKQGSDNLTGLASVAGINLAQSFSSNGIPKELYPKLVKSTPFLLELLNTELTLQEENKTVSYKDYYLNYHRPSTGELIKKYTLGLPGLIKRSLKEDTSREIKIPNESIITLSDEDFDLIKRMIKKITIQSNSDDGAVSLSFEMPNPVFAATMVKKAEILLKEKLIQFKTEFLQENINTTNGQFKQSEIEYLTTQGDVDAFRDSNVALNSERSKSQLRDLELKRDLAFGIYDQLVKLLQQEKLELQRQKPSFMIIEPATVPKTKSSPNRPLILFLFSFIGVLVSVLYVIIVPRWGGILRQNK